MTNMAITLLLSLVIFTAVMLGMAVGIMFRRKPLVGSCGGLSTLTGERCQICGGDPQKCENAEANKPG